MIIMFDDIKSLFAFSSHRLADRVRGTTHIHLSSPRTLCTFSETHSNYLCLIFNFTLYSQRVSVSNNFLWAPFLRGRNVLCSSQTEAPLSGPKRPLVVHVGRRACMQSHQLLFSSAAKLYIKSCPRAQWWIK